MIRFLNLAILLMLCQCIPLTAQTTIDWPHDFMTTDKLQQVYLAQGNKIRKYSHTGQLLGECISPGKGKVSIIDAMSPFKILIFEPEFNQVSFLDNRLAPLGAPANLDGVCPQGCNTVCASVSSSFWVYNHQNAHAQQYGLPQMELIQQVEARTQMKENENPLAMQEYSQELFLACPQSGLLRFDAFGDYTGSIDIGGSTSWQFKGDELLFVRNDSLQQANLLNYSNETLFVKRFKGAKQVRWASGLYYVSDGNKLLIIKE